jgi:hypothetical protein
VTPAPFPYGAMRMTPNSPPMPANTSRTLARKTATIQAIPRSIQSSFGFGKTRLVWRTERTTRLEVHVDAPDGRLLAYSQGSGDVLTGPWVSDGMTFFLQDLSDTAAPAGELTLDRVVVHVVPHHDTLAEFTAFVATRFGATHIVDVTSLCPNSARQLALDFRLIGIGPQPSTAEDAYESWIATDLKTPSRISLSDEIVSNAVVLLRDRLGSLPDLEPLLERLTGWLRRAPAAIVSVPVHAALFATAADPVDASVVFEEWLRARGFNVAFTGISPVDAHETASVLAVLERSSVTPPAQPPASFRVAAIIVAYNEEDIIVPSITRLLDQGIAVHLVENWSTDATFDLAKTLSAHGLFTLERFPKDGPSHSYDWQALLQRVETVSRWMRADWFFFQDADEIRYSPWPGLDLRTALHRVDAAGFNCVDHTLLDFHPVDNSFPSGGDLEAHLHWFEFGHRPDHFTQLKAWKNTGEPVSLADSGGHEIRFPGRRVFPYKFFSQHYPIRSQAQGEKKVFDRQARWNAEERAKGWHVQYDGIRHDHNFLRNPDDLVRFEKDQFYRRYLLPRLSGVGVPLVLASPSQGARGSDCD